MRFMGALLADGARGDAGVGAAARLLDFAGLIDPGAHGGGSFGFFAVASSL